MEDNRGRAAGLLLAGGRGSRARLAANKAYVEVGGVPMITHSLRTLDRSPWVIELVLVIRPEDRPLAEEAVAGSEVTTPWQMVDGGDTRHSSETCGLEALAKVIGDGEVDLVAVHDSARPFLSSRLLENLFQEASRHGGAVPSLELEGPLFGVSDHRELHALPHRRLHRAQTPQVFSAPPLLAAYRRARQAGFVGVDTAETVKRFSDLRVKAVPGDPENRKLTFPEDFPAHRE